MGLRGDPKVRKGNGAIVVVVVAAAAAAAISGRDCQDCYCKYR
jgi:hypothetical protein